MLYLTLSNARQRVHFEHSGGPLEVGRGPMRELPRLVVEDAFTSRDQLRLEPAGDGRVRITNLGAALMVGLGSSLAPGQTQEVELPTRIAFGYSLLEVSSTRSTDGGATTLPTAAQSPRRSARRTPHDSLRPLGDSPSMETLMEWFEKLLHVQRAAAGSGEFYQETARAVVELIGLDRGAVLLRANDQWELAASYALSAELERPVSQAVLDRVARDQRTFFEATEAQPLTQSLVGIEYVVASPIFDEQEKLAGVLYGTRDRRSAGLRYGVTPLEAQVVQLLAGAVSMGLARLGREAEIARRRVQFEQFFSPELARALERNASLLEGQQREVTVMFSDLRGFSSISEQVGAKQTYELLSDVMDRLTSHILESGGVVIDYYGDGLAAMWNAPAEQPDHARRACQAAVAMRRELPELNRVWAPLLGRPVGIGIGINTGSALVGNAGSKRRLKYGPRGHVVNLANRVEGATKLLGVGCLMTDNTVSQLPDTIQRRRVCRAYVTGIQQPVDLHELVVDHDATLSGEALDLYAEALAAYERGELAKCEVLCGALRRGAGHLDVPTRLLAERASQARGAPPELFEPIYRLETK